MPHHGSPYRTDTEIASLLGRTDPEPPSTVDISGVVHNGRRRVRRRRLLAFAGAAAVTAVVVAAVPTALSAVVGRSGTGTTATAGPSTRPSDAPRPPTSCQLEHLRTLPGTTQGSVMVGDPTGRYLAGEVLSSNGKQGLVRWNDGTPQVIPLPATYGGFATDVNSSGVVVGYSEREVDGTFLAWAYHTGPAHNLAGRNAAAHGVNESGQITGDLDVAGRSVPVVWESITAEPAHLSIPAGAHSGSAADIADDGTVVGFYKDGSGRVVPYLWMLGGGARELKTTSARHAMPVSIRGEWVTGLGYDDDPDDGWPVAWNLRTGNVQEYRDLRGPQSSSANTHGWIAGQRDDRRAHLLTPTREVQLPTNAPSHDGLGDSAVFVSDDGRIVAGSVLNNAGLTTPAVWRCR